MRTVGAMIMADYKCPDCREVAWKGNPTMLLNDPRSAYLELHCGYGGHESWGIDIKCSGCGRVPSYLIWQYGKRDVPVLKCCGNTWAPRGYMVNPFYDERAI